MPGYKRPSHPSNRAIRRRRAKTKGVTTRGGLFMPTGMAKILDVVAPGITEDLGVTTAPEPATSRRLVRLVDDRGGHLGYVDPDTNRLYTPNLSPSVELIVDPRTGAKRNSKAHLRRKNAARDLGFKP